MTWEVSEKYPFVADLFSAESTARWETMKQRVSTGALLTGKIYARTVFGVFLDAGLGFPVLMTVTDFGKPEGGMIFPDDYPALESIISGYLGGFHEHNRQVTIRSIGV